MKEFNYVEAVTADVIDVIRDNYTPEEIRQHLDIDRDDFTEKLNDDLWIDDAVTGNASGSYTFSSYKARCYVLEDIETVIEAVREFCCGMDAAEILQKVFNEEWEYFDVTARCYVLGQAIENALDKLDSDTADIITENDDEEKGDL